jgi:hypothetical protein
MSQSKSKKKMDYYMGVAQFELAKVSNSYMLWLCKGIRLVSNKHMLCRFDKLLTKSIVITTVYQILGNRKSINLLSCHKVKVNIIKWTILKWQHNRSWHKELS